VSIRVLIVDDEAVARRRLRRLLANEADVVVAGECGDGRTAVHAIARDAPDLVFLDVRMPELDGFEVVQSIAAAERPKIVFVTAFDRYALRAFDVHAVDYLLKPFTRERFHLALGRARERRAERPGDPRLPALLRDLRSAHRYPSRVAVRAGDKYVVVNWRDVDWIEAADNYVSLHVGPREFLLRDTLASIEQQLDPEQFVRIHRSAIVQLDRVVELRPATHGDVQVKLRNGACLALSRTWRQRVERLCPIR
jgi:two-component system, LytTR family, response regulator